MKKVLIILSILLLSGCSINYNLEISSDSFIENIEGTIPKNEFDTPDSEIADLTIYNYIYTEQYAIMGGEQPYEKELTEKGNEVNVKYSHAYKGDFKNSQIMNSCYENVLFKETDDLYVIKLGGDFSCSLANKITVNITTDYTVVNNNANKVKGNTYTWKLEKGSTDIEMDILKKKKDNNFSPDKGLHYFRLIGTILFAILCGVVGYIYFRKTKNSER